MAPTGRRWGRHTLDPRVAAHIVAAAGIGPGHLVVDLGAGTGALTVPLVRAGARVIAVELHAGRLVALRRLADVDVVAADLASFRWPRTSFRVVANPPWALAETVRARLLAAPSLVQADLVVPRWLARRWAAGDPRISVGASVRAEAFSPPAPCCAAVAVLRPPAGRRRA